MKIKFAQMPGFESYIWDYNEEKNCATYTPPANSSKETNKSIKPIEIPKGIRIDESGVFIIDNVKEFAVQYPYKRVVVPTVSLINIFTPPNNTLPSSVALTSRKKEKPDGKSPPTKVKKHTRPRSFSESAIILTTLESEPILTKNDYPQSIQLDILIGPTFNSGMRGRSTAYARLADKQVEPQPKKVKAEKSLIQDENLKYEIIQIKALLLGQIKNLLEKLDPHYLRFIVEANLSHVQRKQITDFLCNAVVQTMDNKEIKNAPSLFALPQKGKVDLLFPSTPDIYTNFNTEELEIRIKALTLYWSMLLGVETGLELPTEIAGFSAYLKGIEKALPELRDYLVTIQKTIIKLISIEQKQAAHELEYILCSSKGTAFRGFHSLHSVLCEHLRDAKVNDKKELIPEHFLKTYMVNAIARKITNDAISLLCKKNKGEFDLTQEIYIDGEYLQFIQIHLAKVLSNKDLLTIFKGIYQHKAENLESYFNDIASYFEPLCDYIESIAVTPIPINAEASSSSPSM